MIDTPDLNDPEQLLDYLSAPILATYEGLDHGVSLADAKMSDLPPNPHLWSHLVRFGARQHLEDLEPEDWTLGRALMNSGIEVSRGPIVFRTLKAQAGGPPHPGTSSSRRGFYAQRRLPIVFHGVVFPDGANLILDWTVTAQREVHLALSKPYGIWLYRGNPRIEWRRPVSVDGHELRFTAAADEDIPVEFDLSELAGDKEGE